VGLSGLTFLRVQRNRLKIANKIYFYFLMRKTNGLSTIVWVSILVQAKLPLRVRRFGQKLGQKVLPCWTLASSVKGQRGNLIHW